MKISKFVSVSLALGALALAGGCQSQQVNQKEQATEAWNAARGNVMYSMAKEQFEGNVLDKARESIEQAKAFDTKSAPVRILSAKIAIEQGQLEFADRELAVARQLDVKSAEAEYLSGVIYQRWQKPQMAYEFYERACEKAPADLSYLMAKSEMQVAMDHPAEALATLEDKVVYFEHSAAIRDAVGELYVRQKSYEKGADMLRQATILAPQDSIMREHLAMALFYARSYRSAIVELRRLLIDPSEARRPDLFMTLGECQFQLGQYRDARDAFETASTMGPSIPGIWLGLGKCAMEVGDLPRAELSIRKALALDSSSAQTHLLLGYLRVRQQRYEDALREFYQLSLKDKDDTMSLCMIGYVLQKLGRNQEALDYYGKALKVKPDDELASKLMASVQTGE